MKKYRTHYDCYFFKGQDDSIGVQTPRETYIIYPENQSVTLNGKGGVEKIAFIDEEEKITFYPADDCKEIQ